MSWSLEWYPMEEMPLYNSRIPSHSTIITVAGIEKNAIMMFLLNVNAVFLVPGIAQMLWRLRGDNKSSLYILNHLYQLLTLKHVSKCNGAHLSDSSICMHIRT